MRWRQAWLCLCFLSSHICWLRNLGHGLCPLLLCKAPWCVLFKGFINKFDLDFDCSSLFHPVIVFHYRSPHMTDLCMQKVWLDSDSPVYSGEEECLSGIMCGWPSCQICLVGSSSYTNCSGMRGPNKYNTCFGDRTNIQPTSVNPLIAVAAEAQASEHINQSRDYIHLSHGHSSLHAGPTSCWHCLRLCCLPLLLPILTVLPIRRAGERATNLEGCWLYLPWEACLAFGAKDERGYWCIRTMLW